MARVKTKTSTSTAHIPCKTWNTPDSSYRDPDHEHSDPEPSDKMVEMMMTTWMMMMMMIRMMTLQRILPLPWELQRGNPRKRTILSTSSTDLASLKKPRPLLPEIMDYF